MFAHTFLLFIAQAYVIQKRGNVILKELEEGNYDYPESDKADLPIVKSKNLLNSNYKANHLDDLIERKQKEAELKSSTNRPLTKTQKAKIKEVYDSGSSENLKFEKQAGRGVESSTEELADCFDCLGGFIGAFAEAML